MTSVRRGLLALALSAAGVSAGLVATAASSTAATPPVYAALGDSYAAGYGLPAPAVLTGQPVPGCAQTDLDYPHQVATALHLALTDIACSGAKTDDFYAPQPVNGPSPAAQLDALAAAKPSVVTVTIGGNDLGFSTIATDCIAGTPTGPLLLHPTFSTCQDYYNSSAQGGGKAKNPYDKLAATVAKVRAAVAAVKRAAPKAKVYVIAYPAIAPDAANTPAGGCFAAELTPPGTLFPSALPFTDSDVPYLQKLQQQLDTRIGNASTAVGAHYVDIYPQSLTHSACSPESTRWVEPVLPGGGGTNSLHPSLAGTRAMATALVRAMVTG